MQVENHKEEVPFEHYESAFAKADAAEMAARTGAKWDGKEFYVNLLGTQYAISHPVYGIREVGHEIATPVCELARNDNGDVALPGLNVQTFLLRYLLESKAVAGNGSWKTFREMPWGELYIKPYTGRVLTRAAFTFGTRLAAFKSACQKMGAVPVDHGDAGFQFDLIGDFKMQILVWEGDEEFPPNAQVLYSDNFQDGFAPEDRVVAGDILISVIKSNM